MLYFLITVTPDARAAFLVAASVVGCRDFHVSLLSDNETGPGGARWSQEPVILIPFVKTKVFELPQAMLTTPASWKLSPWTLGIAQMEMLSHAVFRILSVFLSSPRSRNEGQRAAFLRHEMELMHASTTSHSTLSETQSLTGAPQSPSAPSKRNQCTAQLGARVRTTLTKQTAAVSCSLPIIFTATHPFELQANLTVQ